MASAITFYYMVCISANWPMASSRAFLIAASSFFFLFAGFKLSISSLGFVSPFAIFLANSPPNYAASPPAPMCVKRASAPRPATSTFTSSNFSLPFSTNLSLYSSTFYSAIFLSFFFPFLNPFLTPCCIISFPITLTASFASFLASSASFYFALSGIIFSVIVLIFKLLLLFKK